MGLGSHLAIRDVQRKPMCVSGLPKRLRLKAGAAGSVRRRVRACRAAEVLPVGGDDASEAPGVGSLDRGSRARRLPRREAAALKVDGEVPVRGAGQPLCPCVLALGLLEPRAVETSISRAVGPPTLATRGTGSDKKQGIEPL